MTQSVNTKRVLLKDMQGNFLIPYTDGGGSSSGILPDGYAITVATDGSGDFTDIQSALNSLDGKACAGILYVKLKAGDTFNVSSTITLPATLNTATLYICSDTANSLAYIVSSAATTLSISQYVGYCVYFQDLSFEGDNQSHSWSRVVSASNVSTYMIRCTVLKAYFGYLADNGGKLLLNNCIAKNCNTGVQAYYANIHVYNNFNIQSCTTGFGVYEAGVIQAGGGTLTKTSVTNLFGKTKNQIDDSGVIISNWS